jgi:hypothetical protein
VQTKQAHRYVLRARGLPSDHRRVLVPATLWVVGGVGTRRGWHGGEQSMALVYRVPLLPLGSWVVDLSTRDVQDRGMGDAAWDLALGAAVESHLVRRLPPRYSSPAVWRREDPDGAEQAAAEAEPVYRRYLEQARLLQTAVVGAHADRYEHTTEVLEGAELREVMEKALAEHTAFCDDLCPGWLGCPSKGHRLP